MQQGFVVNLSSNLSMMAAKISLEYSLPMADSIILATGRRHGATIWTQDSDFEGLEGVQYTPKKK